MKRVCCLYRVSTLNQVDQNGKDEIPMQKQACHDFVSKQQDWKIVLEFQELGVSGFKVSAKDRDVVQDIQKAAVEGEFDILLVFMFDRIGRREDETPFVVEWFTQQGIEVWSTQEGQQRFDNHVDKLMNYIRYWQASGESIKTSLRTKTSMGQMVQDGYCRGGICPYGYRLVKRGRVNKRGHEVNDIEINPEEAEVVRMIFNKYTYEGYGINRIIGFLAGEGIKNHRGNRFSFSSIRFMISSVLYIGILKSGDTLSESFPHLQIVENDVFEKAQEIRLQRSNEYEPQRQLPLQTKGKSLLSGNIFCEACGGRLSLTTNNRKYAKSDGTQAIYKRVKYICFNKSRKITPCDGQSGYTSQKLDDIISMLLLDLFKNVKGTPEKDLMEKRYQSDLAIAAGKLKAAKAEAKKLEISLKTLQDEVVGAIMGTSKFDSGVLNDLIKQTGEKLAVANDEVIRYELEMGSKQKSMSEIKVQYRNLVSWADIFSDSDMEVKKMIVAYLIESIKVSRGYEVEVKFHVAYEQFFESLTQSELNIQTKVG